MNVAGPIRVASTRLDEGFVRAVEFVEYAVVALAAAGLIVMMFRTRLGQAEFAGAPSAHGGTCRKCIYLRRDFGAGSPLSRPSDLAVAANLRCIHIGQTS